MFLRPTAFAPTAFALCLTVAAPVWAQDSDTPPQVIEPEVERRDLDVGKVDSENFELSVFAGCSSRNVDLDCRVSRPMGECD